MWHTQPWCHSPTARERSLSSPAPRPLRNPPLLATSSPTPNPILLYFKPGPPNPASPLQIGNCI